MNIQESNWNLINNNQGDLSGIHYSRITGKLATGMWGKFNHWINKLFKLFPNYQHHAKELAVFQALDYGITTDATTAKVVGVAANQLTQRLEKRQQNTEGHSFTSLRFLSALIQKDTKSAMDFLSSDFKAVCRFGESQTTLLQWAIELDQEEIAIELLKRGGAHFLNNKDISPLPLAVGKGFTRLVTELLKLDAQNRRNATAEGNNTPLHIAAATGQLEVVRILLDYNLDIDAQNSRDASPLHLAIENHHPDVAALLVNHGASLDEPGGKDGLTPTAMALGKKDIEGFTELNQLIKDELLHPKPVVASKILHAIKQRDHKNALKWIKRGGDFAETFGEKKQTLLHIAIEYRLGNISKALLEKGAPLEAQDSDGNTPLHTEILTARNYEFAAEMVKHGAPLTTKNAKGESPIRLAKTQSSWLLQQMKEKSPELIPPDTQEIYGAIKKKDSATVIGYINHEEVDLAQIITSRKDTILGAAVIHSLDDVVEALIAKNVSLETKDTSGETPLHHACSDKDRTKVAKILIENGANIHAVSGTCATPLYTASMAGNVELITLLLKKGAEIDFVPEEDKLYKETPLHGALKFGEYQAALFLVNQGANLHLKDAEGRTPLDMAQKAVKNYEEAKPVLEAMLNRGS